MVVTLTLWSVALVVAFLLDQPVSQWLYDLGFHDPRAGIIKSTPWARAIKMIGSFQAVAVLAAALLVAGAITWRKAAILLACAATSIITDPLKWMVGRARPVDDAGLLTAAMDFVPFTTRDPANSFPSGHAMIAFATAACLAVYYPKWRPLIYAIATLVAVERVLEVAHHVSDVVAAAGIGVALSYGCMRALARWSSQPTAPSAQAELG